MSTRQQFISDCIEQCQQWLFRQGLKAKVHFELEGMAQMPEGMLLNYDKINEQLCNYRIAGELKPEYWPGQWEYVSIQADQSPLQEATFLHRAMELLPHLMKQQGARQTMLKPVVWHGSKQRYVAGSDAIFAGHGATVHVPNAIQINVSVHCVNKGNLMPNSGLGEWLQYLLLQNSYACSLLYLPEEDAYRRLALRNEYGLDTELSSPWELSGGYQGSIALYKDKGKHNQEMGLKLLLVGLDEKPLLSAVDWHETCRVEHRLGATSPLYDPFINVLFVLLNVLAAVEHWRDGSPAPEFVNRALPTSLWDTTEQQGAVNLFEADQWLQNSIDRYCQQMKPASVSQHSLGKRLKDMILQQYQPDIVAPNFESLK